MRRPGEASTRTSVFLGVVFWRWPIWRAHCRKSHPGICGLSRGARVPWTGTVGS